MTHPYGPRPNFFIVGAPKCGTTALHDTLSGHPEIFMSTPKEPHHFASDLTFRFPPPRYASDERYLRLFADATEPVRGESSVWNLYSEVAARRIADAAPDGRALCLLRNPVDLVCSMHEFAFRNGSEPYRRLTDALAAEPRRARGVDVPPTSHAPWSLRYRAIADFEPQVRRYLAAFPPDRFKVVLQEAFRDDPRETVRDILHFLDVSTDQVPEVRRSNVSADFQDARRERVLRRVPRLRAAAVRVVPRRIRRGAKAALGWVTGTDDGPPVVAAADLEALTSHFAPMVERLGDLLGRSLDEWRVSPASILARRTASAR